MLRDRPSLRIVDVSRDRYQIRGRVQGVGFRPFVYRVARECGLTGTVANDSAGVTVEVQGPEPALATFHARLRTDGPAAAEIREILVTRLGVEIDERDFRIIGSAAGESNQTEIAADMAVCPACLAEMRDHRDRRRHAYGLVNCTQCGPRFSIIRRVPYDRPNTTMAAFEMCHACRAEYDEIADRRFHAQPTACHDCGPRVQLVEPEGRPIPGDAFALAAQLLVAGRILAIKGVGGFHLAVRADDDNAVKRLRQIKHRLHKPLAVMAPDIDAARSIAHLSDAAVAALTSPAAPIVLATRLAAYNVSHAVSGQSHRIGVMLPYTPMHHLLFDALNGRVPALVMTSGNDSDEPLVTRNAEAVGRLAGCCDAILLHDRAIERPVDDSVMLDLHDGDLLPIRRSRGYVPTSIPLPAGCESSGLCVGGELKNTVTVVRNGEAIVSQHLGDLVNSSAYENFRQVAMDLCDLFDVTPQWIARDLHPAYLSSQYAVELAAERGVRCVTVQHHYAHAASVLAEHGRTDRVLAVVCDGTGYGDDGTTWGGELLAADLDGYERLARLKPIKLPGGDATARAPWRSALALLHGTLGDGFVDHPAARAVAPDADQRTFVAQMLISGAGCSTSSSAGRVFDAVAAIVGLGSINHYEAQAPMALESAVIDDACDTDLPGDLFALDGIDIDLGLLVRQLLLRQAAGASKARLAALFHDGFAAAWAAAVGRAARAQRINTVALSGGVFANQRLTVQLTNRLRELGLEVLRHRVVPPNDGGLSLGQAAVAARRGRRN